MGKREQETKEGNENWRYMERSYGSFCRSFNVPPGTKKSDISANYKDGVLEVTVKKPPMVEDQAPIMIE